MHIHKPKQTAQHAVHQSARAQIPTGFLWAFFESCHVLATAMLEELIGQVELSLTHGSAFEAILLNRHNTTKHVVQDGLSLKDSQKS